MGVFESVRTFIRREDLVPEGTGVIAAVSGGADSRCVLDCLHRMGIDLTVAHLDHGLRPESTSEAEFVREIARRYGYPFVTERWQAPDETAGVEQAARWARYRFLVRVAEGVGFSRIATGHTLSDQAETILLHLVRGASLDGLTGMEPSTDLGEWRDLDKAKGLYLVRPLLGISHADAVEYCRKRGLRWLEDPSNLSTDYGRNLIRLRVMPLLEQINPKAQEALTRSGQSLKPVRELLELYGRAAWKQAVIGDEPDRIVFNQIIFANQPHAIQVWLVRQAAERLLEGIEVGYEASLELARALAEGGYQPRQLPPGLDLVQDKAGPALIVAGSLSYLTGYPQLGGVRIQTLGVPGDIELQGGWRLRARPAKGSEVAREGIPREGDGWSEIVDPSAGEELRVRGFQAGDRIQPLGMEGRIKVGDLFTNEKIPVAARAAWPIVTTGSGEVVWIAGLRLAHPFRVRPEAEQLVILEVLPPD